MSSGAHVAAQRRGSRLPAAAPPQRARQLHLRAQDRQQRARFPTASGRSRARRAASPRPPPRRCPTPSSRRPAASDRGARSCESRSRPSCPTSCRARSSDPSARRRIRRRRSLEHRRRRAGRFDPVAFALEQQPQRFEDVGLIVGDQDARRPRRRSASNSSGRSVMRSRRERCNGHGSVHGKICPIRRSSRRLGSLRGRDPDERQPASVLPTTHPSRS